MKIDPEFKPFEFVLEARFVASRRGVVIEINNRRYQIPVSFFEKISKVRKMLCAQ